jgi:predicted transcriptional regulator
MSNASFYKYNNINTPGYFKVSPSTFNNLLLSAGDWYNSQVLNKSAFTGNKKTVLGTCIHARIEMHYTKTEFSKKDEDAYINSQNLTQEELEYVNTNIEPMWSAVLYDYINKYPEPYKVESSTTHYPDWYPIAVAGSIDAIVPSSFNSQNSAILDWKTTEKKPSKMSMGHFIQGLLYAYSMRDTVVIDSVRIVYIVAPTKTLPARIFIFEEEVTPMHMNWIEHQLKILSKKFQLLKDDPSLEEVLFVQNPDSYLNENKNPFDALKRLEPSKINLIDPAEDIV